MDDELISRLQWRDIPDTRRIQQERIQSIGEESQHERQMRLYEEQSSTGRDRRYSTAKRLVLLPEDQLREVYSLAIPLAVPLCDFSVSPDHFHNRWVNAIFQKGAMHLTTQAGLERLLEIFNRYRIPIKDEPEYGPKCECEKESSRGKVVPHSWFVDIYDPDERLFEHQFVVYEQRVFLLPPYHCSAENNSFSR